MVLYTFQRKLPSSFSMIKRKFRWHTWNSIYLPRYRIRVTNRNTRSSLASVQCFLRLEHPACQGHSLTLTHLLTHISIGPRNWDVWTKIMCRFVVHFDISEARAYHLFLTQSSKLTDVINVHASGSTSTARCYQFQGAALCLCVWERQRQWVR